LVALLQLNDELGFLSFSFLFTFLSGVDGGGLNSEDVSISISAKEFSDLDADSDGISESVKFDVIEIHQEELGQEDIESSVSLSGDLDFIGAWLDLLNGLVFHSFLFLYTLCFEERDSQINFSIILIELILWLKWGETRFKRYLSRCLTIIQFV